MQTYVEVGFVSAEHLARLGATHGTHDAGPFELVHKASGAVVTYGEFALNERGGALLVHHHKAGGLLEHGVDIVHVQTVASTASLVALHLRFGQFESGYVALLVADVVVDAFHLRRVDKGALHTHGVVA